MGLALLGVVIVAWLSSPPWQRAIEHSAWGQALTLVVGGGIFMVAMGLAQAWADRLPWTRLKRDSHGVPFSVRGSIAADEADAHPRLVALAGDIGARRRRRLSLRMELLPGRMILTRVAVRKSTDGAPSVTLGTGELVTVEAVRLLYGSGLAVRMRDGTTFALVLQSQRTVVAAAVARWRDAPAPAFSFPGAEHYEGFLHPVTPAATTLPTPDVPEPVDDEPAPRNELSAAEARRRARRVGIGLLIVLGLIVGVTVPVVAYQNTSCGRARHLIDQANEDLSGYFGQIKDLRTVYPPRDEVPVAVGDEHSLSAEQIASSRKDPDAWMTALRRSGFTSGWIQAYLSPLGLNEQVFQFRSHEAALDFQAWATRFSCGYTSHVFTVPNVPNTIGLEIRYRDLGTGEQVSFVRGARRYLIGIQPTTTRFPTIPVSDIEVMTQAAAIYAR
jgi:hypothetical protein